MIASSLFNNGPVTERLGKLQSLFRDHFPPKVQHGLCLWLVADRDEVTMLNAMIQTEGTEGSVFSDLFIPFLGGNAGAVNFHRDNGDQLREYLRSVKDELTAAGVDSSLWEEETPTPTLRDLINYTHRVANALPHLKGRVIMYFSPSSVSNETAFALELAKALEEGLPAGFILMYYTGKGSFTEGHLSARKDLGVVALTPNLNMAAAAQELLATGDPTNPKVRFQKLFQGLSEHGARGAFDLMRKDGNEAIAIAQQLHGWEYMVASVLITMGSLLLARESLYGEALDCFIRARREAETARNAGNPSAEMVLTQAITFEALGYFYKKEYQLAAMRYEEASGISEDEAQAFTRFETLRMATLCYLEAGEIDKAWEVGLFSLDHAETLDLALAGNSTVPFLGRDLLRIIERKNLYQRENEIRRRLEAMIGEDWERKLEAMESNWKEVGPQS